MTKETIEYNLETQKKLKEYIFQGKIDEFIALYEEIKTSSSGLAEKYRDRIEDEKKSLLFWAAIAEAGPQIMSFLIDNGASLEDRDNKGRTPLSIAIEYGYLTNIKYLLAKGADPKVKCDSYGNTPLHIAAYSASSNDMEERIKLLLETGVEIAEINNNGETPVHIAAHCSYKALHALVKYQESEVRALLKITDCYGETPLHSAARDESGISATYLLYLGADKTLKNNEGKTPAEIAKEWGSEKTKQAIIKFTGETYKDAEAYYQAAIAKEKMKYGEDGGGAVIEPDFESLVEEGEAPAAGAGRDTLGDSSDLDC